MRKYRLISQAVAGEYLNKKEWDERPTIGQVRAVVGDIKAATEIVKDGFPTVNGTMYWLEVFKDGWWR